MPVEQKDVISSGDEQVTDDPTLSVTEVVEDVKADSPADDPNDFEAVLDDGAEEPPPPEPADEEPPPEPEPEPEQPETDEVSFDPSLLAAAGLTPEQASTEFKSPEILEAFVRRMNQTFVQHGQQYMGQAGAQQQQPPAPQTAETPDDASGLPQFQMPKPSGQDDWDDDTKALVNALNEHYQKALVGKLSAQEKRLQEQQEALLAVIQERQHLANQEYVNKFDNFVNGLGDEWSGVLGKGRVYEISPLYQQTRSHLDNVAAQLQAGRRAFNHPEMATEDLLKLALPIAFPEVQQKAVVKDVRSKIVERQKMKTARPTQRRSTQLTGEAKAAARVKEWFESRGMAAYDDEDFSDDI